MASASPIRGLLLSAGAGAFIALAGICLVKKVEKYFKTKPKVRLIQNDLLLSTRCAWFLSELDAEEDFQITTDETMSFTTETLISELEALPFNAEQQKNMHGRLLRQEDEYQVVEYSPLTPLNSSREDLCILESDVSSDYGSQDRSMTPSMSACVINDEFTLIEGAAICMYLADLYGQFLPDTEHRAEYYSWIVYSAATFDSIVKTLHLQIVDTPDEQRNNQVLDSALSGFNAFARALTQALKKKKYLCGDSFTTADCVLGFTLWWASTIDQGRLLDSYPVLRTYLNTLRSRRAFRKTLGQQDLDFGIGHYFITCIKDSFQE